MPAASFDALDTLVGSASWPDVSFAARACEAPAFGVVLSIIAVALPADTVVVVTRVVDSTKLPMLTPQFVPLLGSSLHSTPFSSDRTVWIAWRNGLIFAPPGSVLKVSARVAMVMAEPPAAFDRSEMTGTGVKMVSITGCSGLVASTICCR